MKKFNVLAFGLAGGLTWALAMIMLAGAAAWFDWGTMFVELIGDAYIGYEASLVGALLGALWGFVDLFIGAIVFAALYNLFAGKK